jgi:2-polyprenyl-3-methyl-5-hydroxy-6-metoxy-1,4-benzoquinol methylase
MTNYREQMMRSWRTNAVTWTRAIRDRQIESRHLVTDAAILAAIRRIQPKSMLDIGCGEGWLCRAVSVWEIAAVGIDASPELIDQAKSLGGEFYVSCYETIPDLGRQFDLIVCNFSLLEEDLDDVMRQMGMRLTPQGSLLIQTVHPDAIADNTADGWHIENFANFGADFSAPMPWYFRQRESWADLLIRNGFVVEAIQEPAHPGTAKPLSLLLSCKVEKPMV